jgi:LDH2 family malate/lactate/ureidoglycolate dehydrogenase
LLAGAALPRGEVQDYGFLFIAIDPAILLGPGMFAGQMSELVERMRATPLAPGVDGIRIPSERAFRERARRREEGIVLDRLVVESLRGL